MDVSDVFNCCPEKHFWQLWLKRKFVWIILWAFSYNLPSWFEKESKGWLLSNWQKQLYNPRDWDSVIHKFARLHLIKEGIRAAVIKRRFPSLDWLSLSPHIFIGHQIRGHPDRRVSLEILWLWSHQQHILRPHHQVLHTYTELHTQECIMWVQNAKTQIQKTMQYLYNAVLLSLSQEAVACCELHSSIIIFRSLSSL